MRTGTLVGLAGSMVLVVGCSGPGLDQGVSEGEPFGSVQQGLVKAKQGDYDGDGKADIVTWSSDGRWRIKASGGTSIPQIILGDPDDILVPGDYDGDGRYDTAIWRPKTGTWWVRSIATGATSPQQWGAA